MRTLLIALVVLAGARAQAGVLDIYGQVQAGGGSGRGVAGTQKDSDFFEGAQGAAYGARVGVEALFIDGWVEHMQFTDFSGLTGTWTQIMAGFDIDFSVSDAPKGQKPKTYGEVGFALGFGMGTGQQIDPPLDNTEITDKGPVVQIAVGVEHRLASTISIGLTVPVTYGYMFKSGAANDENNQYQSLSATPFAYLRLHFGAGN